MQEKTMQRHTLIIEAVYKNYPADNNKAIEILKNINLSIDKGEIIGLIGPSGSGKTTLLQIAGLIDKADSGEVIFDGMATSAMKLENINHLLKLDISFIYQFHHLFPEFTALENVMMPLIINGQSIKKAKIEACKIMDEMSLSHRYNHIPAKLSGGEQQRVAIARALVKNPKLILADEPTGSIDPKTGNAIFSNIIERVRERSIAMLCVTHNHNLLQHFDKAYILNDGQLELMVK